jgi:hypothetical protein
MMADSKDATGKTWDDLKTGLEDSLKQIDLKLAEGTKD